MSREIKFLLSVYIDYLNITGKAIYFTEFMYLYWGTMG